MNRAIAALICLAMAGSGCTAARAQGSRIVAEPGGSFHTDPALMASYVRQLPLGSRVRVSLADGRVIRGTLMKGDADPIVVQKRTRIPEPPLEIRIRDVQALELEKNGGGTGRAVAIGAAAGAGAALGVILLLAAVFAGS